jgi:anti-sigma-K factor RskA
VTDDPILPPGVPEHDLTAAELALGVLEGDDLAAALRRVLAEPGFARDVERWRLHFAQLFADWPAVAPPETAWPAIARALDGRSGAAVRRPWRWWPATAGVASLVAAGLALVLIVRPAPVPPPAPTVIAARGPVLVAQLAPSATAAGTQAIAAFYDPATGALRLGPAPVAGAGKAAELWVIPADGVPRSMGLLNADRETPMPVDPRNRPLLAPGATLAVSIEPPGGSPTGEPTGPVVVSGILARV